MQNVYTFIDKCLIQEYGIPNLELNSYELDLDDLPDNEVSNLLDRLMLDDTNVRDVVRSHMQKLIDKRLREVTL